MTFSEAVGAGLITMLRVVVLIALASLIWVPIGVWIGLRPRAWPNGCSRWRSSSPLSRRMCFFPLWSWSYRQLSSQSGHLAVAADGARHAVVHPLQRHRRRQRHSRRLERSGRAVYRLRRWQWWRKVISAGDISLLRHWRADGFGRRRGTPASSRRWRAGAIPSSKRPASAPTSPRRPKQGIIHRVVLGIARDVRVRRNLNRVLWRRLAYWAGRAPAADPVNREGDMGITPGMAATRSPKCSLWFPSSISAILQARRDRQSARAR